MMLAIAVSACLVGERCRYDGRAKTNREVCDFVRQLECSGGAVYRMCPELRGGLGCPRPPAEMCSNGSVITWEGADVTREFEVGAALCMQEALSNGIALAILKDGSPSCGCHVIYNGSFDGTVIEGRGIFAQRLIEAGVEVFSEDDIDSILSKMKELTKS